MRGKVLSVIKNTKGIYGFIETQEGNYYYDTSSLIKGSYIKKGATVEFEIIPWDGNKTKAIQVRVVKEAENKKLMEEDLKIRIVNRLNIFMKKDAYIDLAQVSGILSGDGIDYKKYEDSLASFFEHYFADYYSVKKNYTINDKKYPAVLVEKRLGAKPITEEILEKIRDALKLEISKNGFIQAGKLPLILRNVGIVDYRSYAANLDDFLELYLPNVFVVRKAVYINEKRYPKIYVLVGDQEKYVETDEKTQTSVEPRCLDEETKEKVRVGLENLVKEKGFVLSSEMPQILKGLGIDNYKQFASSISEFISSYYSDVFVLKKNVVIEEIHYPGIITFAEKTEEEKKKDLIATLEEMLLNEEYEAVLSNDEALKSGPLDLTVKGIEVLVKAIGGFLGDNVENIHLNAFHRLLIECKTVSDLKPYKDDEEILKLGAETAINPVTIEEFKKVFSNVHNGKKNLNNNWNAIIERFWSAQSEYAVYFTCLWLIMIKNEKCIDTYIEEAAKMSRIDQLPLLLRINQRFGCHNVTVRLQRKIIGRCFDINDIKTLISASDLFGVTKIPEVPELIDFLKGNILIKYETVMAWFHSEIGPQISEKIVNYYWWKYSKTGISLDLFKVLSSVYWEYPENYYTEIIYNPSCPSFGRKEKEQLLKDSFEEICTSVKTFKKGYPWANYLYLTIANDEKSETIDLMWNETRLWMKDAVKAQLSEDIKTATLIGLFRLDSEIRQELETEYCEQIISELVDELSQEDELDSFVESCERQGLQFITQWIVSNSGLSNIPDEEITVQSLCTARSFDEAIHFIQRSKLNGGSKIDLLRFTLSENFKAYTISKEAFKIFDNSIPVDIAETALKTGVLFTEHDVLAALIAIYYYKKEWPKVAYLLAPFRAFYLDAHRKLIEDVRIQAHNEYNVDLTKCWNNHYEVVKRALRVYSIEEFDAFIEWAQVIKIPTNSNKYSPSPRTFDLNIQSLISGGSKDDCWNQLVRMALRTDNKDIQDNIRFCIISSFIGRYGIEKFESEILALSRNPRASKGFSDYYVSLWKGLLNGRYPVNFLRLCENIISLAPVTFWNMFYDVAALKNHVFANNDFEMNSWRSDNQNYQDFYSKVLTQYTETREVVYLKIAVVILKDSPIDLNPEFEKYISFINSASNKAFLLAGIVSLIQRDSYRNEIIDLLDSEYWRCSKSEQEVLRLLRYCCNNDALIGTEYESLSEADLSRFRKDCLKCITEFPVIDVEYALRSTESNKIYRLKLLTELLRIQYYPVMRGEAENAPDIDDNWSEDTLVRDYLRFVSLLYQKQIDNDENQFSDAVFVKNRYLRIFVAKLLLEGSYEDYSDDFIIALMKENKHFSAVYSEYELLKKYVCEFISLDSDSKVLKVTFLIGLLSNDWKHFLDNANYYSTEALLAINRIEEHTNYRDLNIQMIQRYVMDYDSNFSEEEVFYLKRCSPLVYEIVTKIQKIKNKSKSDYLDVKKLVNGICRLLYQGKAQRSYDYMKHALKTYPEEMEKNWDVCMMALQATSYKKTIIINLLADIKKRKINHVDLLLWNKVFQSLEELDVYYYLMSVHYALAKKQSEAREAYANITNSDKIPKEWGEDVKNLKRYISGQSKGFSMTGNNMIQSLVIEKDAESVSFIKDFSFREETTISAAGNAYNTILSKDVEDAVKLSAYRQVFSIINKPDDLFTIYVQSEKKYSDKKSNRLTYNELVIEYGSLLICLDTDLSADEKMQILLEIFAVYEFLNDMNKAKANMLERLYQAEQRVLETPGVCFDQWVSNRDRILGILSHPSIQVNNEILRDFKEPLDECVAIVNKSTSEMQLLERLCNWRKTWNLQQSCSNYEFAFVRSVDEKVKALQAGVNLSVNIISDVIEEYSIFYELHNNAESSNTTIVLDNSNAPGSARLEVLIGNSESDCIPYEGALFTNIVELRPGDYCGQVYRIHESVLSSLKGGEVLFVQLNIIVDKKVICNCSRSLLFTVDAPAKSLARKMTSDILKYETGVPAFVGKVKGFGREAEKKDIQEFLNQQFVVIYGPSRVGKSSLLNYISNDYVDSYSKSEGKSVLTIGIADDRNSSDYSRDMINDAQIVSFGDTQNLLRYLFIAPLKISFGSDPRMKVKSRMRCKYVGERFGENICKEIAEVISYDATAREILTAISQILEENNAEIWYLFDEFQQIVEKWEGDTKEFTDLCNDIMTHQSSIKVVLCGSDELVRLYQCENDIQWNSFVQKTADNGVPVGQMSPEDFKAMMQDEAIWKTDGGENAWSPEALELLYSYTGGNAICGKLFGNELLAKIRRGEFANRSKLYSSDITKVAFELLNSDTGLVKNLLVLHNTKNLDAEIPYLLFIANELIQDRNRSDVSIRRIREFFSAKTPVEVDNALKILLARGILKVNEAKQRYGFSTMFYFDFFRSQVTDAKLLELSILMKKETEANSHKEGDKDPLNLRFIRQYFKEAPSEIQNEFLAGLAVNAKDKDALRGLIGTTQTGTIINGEATFNQVNIQSITNTLNGIMTTSDPKLLLEGIQGLPRLSGYLPQIGEESVESALSEERISRAMDNYVEDMEESLETSCGETGRSLTECWKILKFNDEKEFEGFKGDYAVPQCFFESLQFAYELELLFTDGSLGDEASQIDYSPVTIMYCKLIESLLKEYHIVPYSDSISSVETDLSYRRNGRKIRYRWGEVKRLPQYQKQKLTIGAFVYPIVNDADSAQHIVDLATNTPGKAAEWRSHASFIKEIRDIRNPSAHGNKDHRITLEQMKEISKILIEDGGFKRLITIVKEPI